MNEWEGNDTESKMDWRNQRMDEVAGAQPDEEAEEVEELVTEQPRRGILRHDTPLDVEVVRVQRSDDFDERITDDSGDADPEHTEAAAEQETGMSGRERFKLIRQIVLGTILSADSMRENYRYVISIAVMLFLSIVMLFSSLGSYLRYTKLEDEVHLLRERAIRMSEERYEHSSHSAIVRKLNERGIKLDDPREPHELLD